jgi:hypothetical protein
MDSKCKHCGGPLRGDPDEFLYYAHRADCNRPPNAQAINANVWQMREDLLHVIYNTLMYYANAMNYRGQRTGGVLQGCPRAPDPTPDQMAVHARIVLRMINHELQGHRVQHEWLEASYAPYQTAINALRDIATRGKAPECETARRTLVQLGFDVGT